MPLTSSGLISINDIRLELEQAAGAIGLNDANVRSLLGVSSGAIGLNNAYGKIYFSSITFNSGTSYTYGGYNYRLISASGGTLNIVGTKSIEFLLVGGGGGGGFGGGGGGGGGGIKYIPSALWSSTKSSGVSYYSPIFYLGAYSYFDTLNYGLANGNGANDYRELTDDQYFAATYSGFGNTEYGAPARISTDNNIAGDIAYAAGGGAGGTYYAGGNGGTSTTYFRNGQSGSNRQYVFESRTYSTNYGNYGQVNRNSVFSLSSQLGASPLAGLGTASCGGGAFGSQLTYTGGGGTTSGAAGSGTNGTNIWGGGGGGGLGGGANVGGNRFQMGGHGGAPIQLDPGWATNSAGKRPHVCGGGAGGGRQTPASTTGAAAGGAGGYSYLDNGTIQYNSYVVGAQHPQTNSPYPSRGGPNRPDFDTVIYYYGDAGQFYGFGGCGGAAGTTLDTGSGAVTYRAGGYGSDPLIIAKYI